MACTQLPFTNCLQSVVLFAIFFGYTLHIMWNSLRSRLLTSYLLIIVIVLGLITLTSLAISTSWRVRIGPTLRDLTQISTSTLAVLERMHSIDAPSNLIEVRLKEIAEDQNVRILIIGVPDRHIRFDSQSVWNGRSLNQLQSIDTKQGLLLGATTLELEDPDDHSRWVVLTQPVRTRSDNRFIIAFGRQAPPRLGVFRDTFLPPLLLGSILSLGLAFLLSFFISRSVTAPLEKMVGITESIAEGNYEQTLALEGPDEVQRVAASLNTMMAQVHANQQSQRDFVANVSHDLKTPITSIQGWSQALIDGTADTPETQTEAARVIFSESGRMSRMVNQLLDLARIESGQIQLNMAELDLVSLLQTVCNNSRLRAEEKEVSLLFVPANLGAISGDWDRLTQIFTNLVTNAIAHTPAEGTVTIRLWPHNDKVLIVVEDTGVGIDSAEAERIFERFYQTDKSRSGKGTGLGLAITRELVEAHGGTISADGSVGRGATFTVALPRTLPT